MKTSSPSITLSAADLRRMALRHLERYACSVEGLRRVLRRKVARLAQRAEDDDIDRDAAHTIESVVAALVAVDLLNDARFAEGRVASLLRRGTSLRRIRDDLRAHGVSQETMLAALDDAGDGDGLDQAAAHRLARRRRLGVYRDASDREAHRQRDLAALARAGFAYAVARTVVDDGLAIDRDSDDDASA